MDGAVVPVRGAIRFDQTSDTFVRRLIWGRMPSSLVVENQLVGDVTYAIGLTPEVIGGI